VSFVESDQSRAVSDERIYHPASLGTLLQFLTVAHKVMVQTGREEGRNAIVRVVNYGFRIFSE